MSKLSWFGSSIIRTSRRTSACSSLRIMNRYPLTCARVVSCLATASSPHSRNSPAPVRIPVGYPQPPARTPLPPVGAVVAYRSDDGRARPSCTADDLTPGRFRTKGGCVTKNRTVPPSDSRSGIGYVIAVQVAAGIVLAVWTVTSGAPAAVAGVLAATLIAGWWCGTHIRAIRSSWTRIMFGINGSRGSHLREPVGFTDIPAAGGPLTDTLVVSGAQPHEAPGIGVPMPSGVLVTTIRVRPPSPAVRYLDRTGRDSGPGAELSLAPEPLAACLAQVETRFAHGVTDSIPGPLTALGGLRWLAGSACPHYDGEAARRPAYQLMVGEGTVPAGYAADDGAALLWSNADFDAAFAAGVATTDQAARQAAYFDCQQIALSECPGTVLNEAPIFAAATTKVQGLRLHNRSFLVYTDCWIESE